MNPHIIGLTGSFGSGCSYIKDNILVPAGYKKYSLSEVLKELFEKKTGKDAADVPRKELQDYGDKVRSEKGEGFFTEEIIRRIEAEHDKKPKYKFVIDSIRNPAEILTFRQYSWNFFLFGVYAEKEERWKRVTDKYQGDRVQFDKDDDNDTGNENHSYGQRVGDCFSEADIVFENGDSFAAVGNDDFKRFKDQVKQYISLVSFPLSRQSPIREEEALMAMAYSIGQRSSCMQRKVGAIIVDPLGNVISSGYNEVPPGETPCEGLHTKCYRKKVFEDFFADLKSRIPQVESHENELEKDFRKHFKILDYCRSLHAEENAIVNLARNGNSVPLDKCTIYSTTYPCRMCANKILQAGIKNIVYVEPYPDPEAKLIIERSGANAEFFRGVTYKAYFRLYGEQK